MSDAILLLAGTSVSSTVPAATAAAASFEALDEAGACGINGWYRGSIALTASNMARSTMVMARWVMFGPPQPAISGVTNAVAFWSHSVMTSARTGWLDATTRPSVAIVNATEVQFMVPPASLIADDLEKRGPSSRTIPSGICACLKATQPRDATATNATTAFSAVVVA